MNDIAASESASGRREPVVPSRREQPTHPGRSPAKRRWLRHVWVVLVLGAVAAVAFVLFRDSRDDHAKLQGDWSYSTAGRTNLGTIRIDGDTWSYHSGGPFGRSYRITLRPDANPKQIDLAQLGDDGQPVRFTHGGDKGREVKLRGIYRIRGDEVSVALGVTERPKSFEDEEAQVLVLTR
jgi:uncharacterized protein (TIGR03067 family)